MATRIVSLRFADIIEAIERIRDVLDGAPVDAFEADWQKRWLVERGLEIGSEASRHVPEAVEARYPDIPWVTVAGIGNVLRHAYDRIAPDILWKLAQSDLDRLFDVCRIEYQAALSGEN